MSNATLSIPADPIIIKKAEKNADKIGVSLQELIKTMTDKWLKDFISTEDEATLRIKASALRNDLSEKEAMDIIDTIRQKLPTNQ